jgi:hypothetical protein
MVSFQKWCLTVDATAGMVKARLSALTGGTPEGVCFLPEYTASFAGVVDCPVVSRAV